MNVLLVGKTPAVIADVLREVELPTVTFYTGSSHEEVVATFDRVARVDHVIVGGGLSLDTRLQIEASGSTTVHMNSPSGPGSYLPFVRGVLRGFDAGR